MGKSDWLTQRSRGVHLTIRDVDCIDFDADRLAQDLHEMGVNVLSFFCAGYVTVHPTSLSIRKSPFLGDRDITGDIVKAAHAHGIRAVPAMDLSLIPGIAANEHPQWRSLDRDGMPYKANKDLGDFYIACPLSGYQNEYLSEILKEIVSRYDVDGIKFGGGSYGFSSYGNGICYCARCKESFRAYAQTDIPPKEDWNDPVWGTFQRWRQQRVVDRSKFLYDLVKSLNPDLPVMCNSVCFGDPGWTIKGSLDIERMAEYIDAVQVEAQTRVRVEGEQHRWEFLMMPAEEANFLSTVSDHQPWVLASYFQAWPWRRNAVPPAEQKVYMAQIYANGGNAILNLSGGPPKVHEDQRGFPAVKSLYTFVEHNQEYYVRDGSGANAAILYSQDTLFYYGRDDARARYVNAVRGYEQALSDRHIPFDIISESILSTSKLAQYRTLVLPSTACMSEKTAQAIRAYVEGGGSVIATFETSLYDPDGNRRSDFLLSDLFGVSYAATESVMGQDNGVYKQAYMNLKDQSHQLLEELGDTRVIPASNRFCKVVSNQEATVPLTLSAPFRVFPEGMSYTRDPETGYPMLVAMEHASGGRTVYFPGQPDAAYLNIGYPDWAVLMANAVKWTLRGKLPLLVEAPETLLTTLRIQNRRQLVHLVNVDGGRRMFTKISPVRDVKITLQAEETFAPKRAFLLSDKKEHPILHEEGRISVVIPVIHEYDVLVFEA